MGERKKVSTSTRADTPANPLSPIRVSPLLQNRLTERSPKLADVLAEVRVVIHAADRPAVSMDHGELVVRPCASDEVVLSFSPPDAKRWLSELAEAIHTATDAEGSGKAS